MICNTYEIHPYTYVYRNKDNSKHICCLATYKIDYFFSIFQQKGDMQ